MRPHFVLLLLLLVGSCRARVLPPPSFACDPDSSPTNAEILAFLDGKTLPVPEPRSHPLIIRLEGIEALSVARQGVRNESGDWSTSISIIYNSSRARYDVAATVDHWLVDERRVFSALRFQRVARRH